MCAHVACIPALEWVINSKPAVLADGRKWPACRFKEASKKRMDKLLSDFFIMRRKCMSFAMFPSAANRNN